MTASVQLDSPAVQQQPSASAAASESRHCEVKEDGKLYIKGRACIVKRGDDQITDKALLERLADIFNRTLIDTPIAEHHVWEVKASGITVLARQGDGTLKPSEKPTINFKTRDQEAIYKAEMEEFFKRLTAMLASAKKADDTAPQTAAAPAQEAPKVN